MLSGVFICTTIVLAVCLYHKTRMIKSLTENSKRQEIDQYDEIRLDQQTNILAITPTEALKPEGPIYYTNNSGKS